MLIRLELQVKINTLYKKFIQGKISDKMLWEELLKIQSSNPKIKDFVLTAIEYVEGWRLEKENYKRLKWYQKILPL